MSVRDAPRGLCVHTQERQAVWVPRNTGNAPGFLTSGKAVSSPEPVYPLLCRSSGSESGLRCPELREAQCQLQYHDRHHLNTSLGRFLAGPSSRPQWILIKFGDSFFLRRWSSSPCRLPYKNGTSLLAGLLGPRGAQLPDI